jgi:tetratricopeptide (TPR) repeat protein
LQDLQECINQNNLSCVDSITSINDPKSYEDSSYLAFLSEVATLIQTKVSLDSSLPHFNKYKSEATRLTNIKHQVLSYDKLGMVYVYLSKYDISKDQLEQGIALAEQENLTKEKVQLLIHLAGVYRSEGNLQQAQKIAFEALETAKNNNNYQAEGNVYRTLGSIFGMNRKFEKSRQYSLKASEIFLNLKDSMTYCICNINAANASMSLSKFDTAEVLLSEAIAILRIKYNPYALAGALVQQGRSRYFSLDYTGAITSLNEALKVATSNGNMKQVAYIEKILAETYLKTNNIPEGILHAKKAYDFHIENGVSDETATITKTLSKAYELNGEYKLAFLYYKNYISLKDSLSGDKSAQQLLDMEMKYESKIKQEKIVSLEKEVKLRNQRNTGLLALIAFLIICAFLFINRQRNIIKSNKIITQQKEELHKEQGEKRDILREKLELELSQSKRELISSALKIAEGNELINELELQLKSETNPNASTTKMLRTLSSSRNHEKDWNNFLNAFEAVHPNYIHNLKKINPNLTVNDIRLCSLERMNFDRSQISSILHISIEGVKKARYRLKKKLDLNSETTVVAFLQSI